MSVKLPKNGSGWDEKTICAKDETAERKRESVSDKVKGGEKVSRQLQRGREEAKTKQSCTEVNPE